MALSERITNPPAAHRPGPLCSVGVLVRSLEGAELAALETMLGTPEKRGWTESAIYDTLLAEGYSVARQSINRHRGGRCGCARQA